jgi:PAS domain S-box-containing protein
MPIKAPPEGSPDNKNAADWISDLQSPELAPYWLSAIIESADDAIISKTLDGVITSWNKGAERIFGYTAEEAVGKPVVMLIPEDHQDEEPAILSRLRRGERVEHYETVRVRKDGTPVDISLTVSPIRGPDGIIIGASKIARDISDRKRIEEALRSREEELTDFIENSAVGLHWVGADGTILWANQAELDLLGYSRDEYIGHHIAEFHADREAIDDILERLTHDETMHDYEARLRCKDGSIRHVIISSNVRRRDGEFIHTRCFTHDVTDRKRFEAELREQAEVIETVNRVGQALAGELELRRLVQAVTDAATEVSNAHFGSFFYNVLDEDGASYMLYTLSGAPAEAFSHLPMPRATDLFGATFRGEGTVLIADVKKDPRYGKNSPYYGMPDGHLPVTSYLAVPVVSRSGEVYGGLFLGHPGEGVFTERAGRIVEGLAAQAAVAMYNARLFESAQRARADAERAAAETERLYREAQESNRLKDEFLATVSHELRTPLTAILGWAHMLRTGQSGGNDSLKALETIERNARAQAQLIDDLLDVSRIITGKLRLDVRPVDPNSFIETAVEAVRPAAEAKGVRVQKIMDTGVVSVSGDPVRLQQVVWNLLSNAVKFTPKGGRVQVRLERVNSHVEIAVSDDGAGISPEFLPFVFDRFRQADQRPTRHHGGLGLGLAIVRHLVELHGGTVRAESPGEGQGSTFTVLLPVAPVYQSGGAGERVHPAARDTLPLYECPDRLDGLKILVVDDEPDTRSLLQVGLGRCGAKVTVAGSAPEALEAMAADQPDLLISDIGMPDVDGYELIGRVRALKAEQGGRVPAIALTAYARTEDRLQALRAGYQMHVPKPVEMAELIAVAASLVRRDV